LLLEYNRITSSTSACAKLCTRTTGVTFLTLEDEFGTINVVVWSDLAERQRALVLGARLLGVSGTIEKADDVLHLVAAQLEDHSALLRRLVTTS